MGADHYFLDVLEGRLFGKNAILLLFVAIFILARKNEVTVVF